MTARRSRKATPQLLFVYGTLRHGSGNVMSCVLDTEATFLGRASIRGRLYDLGDYPILTPSALASDAVRGELYELHDPPATLRTLDDYEGCGPNDTPPFEFERRQLAVRLADGRTAEAWVYVYLPSVRGRLRIQSGDYFRKTSRK